MLLLLIGLAFLIISFSSFALAYQINGVNRIVISTPIALFESSIFHDLEIEEPDVYISKELVKEKIQNYYSKELEKITNKYSIEFYFYNKLDNSMCVRDECEAVEILFSATLIFDYKYSRTLNYEVTSYKYGT